ncbi:MAG: methylmalonyl-CoA mutase family protein [Terrimicrobiaceae bacterium]
MSELDLSEFPAASVDDWRKAAEESLKGAPIEKKLFTKTHEGLTLRPIYTSEDVAALAEAWPGLPPFTRGTRPAPHPPLVAQEVPLGMPKAFNEAVLSDLMRGQDALAIHLDVASRCGLDPSEADTSEVAMCGLSLACLDDAQKAFDKIEPSAITTLLWAGATPLPMLGLLTAHSAGWQGGVLGDPLGEYACHGSLPLAWDDAFEEIAASIRWSRTHGERLRTVGVSASIWAEAGGTAVEELAFGLATAVEYLRELDSRGISAADSAGQFVFTYSLGSHVFMQIAKLRAARTLWSKVLTACGAGDIPAFVHGRGSIFNKSRLDPYTNMLRATAEAFSGVIGGVDSLHVAAFDETVRVPGEFSRRIARNVHTILSEECEFAAVADAAGGSWFVESLTTELAGKAWELFQEVEAKGGMKAALIEGFPQEVVVKAAEARRGAAACRRDGWIGVNLFPNPTEIPLEEDAPIDRRTLHAERAAFIEGIRPHAVSRVERSVEGVAGAFLAGATLSQVGEVLPRSAVTEPEIRRLSFRRIAEDYEALRANALRAIKTTGKAPVVWLANFGPAKQHKARADFSAGFFAAGGFDVRQGAGAASPEDAARAAIDSKAPVVVLCSTDETYPDLVPDTVAAIKARRPKTIVILAGYPTEHVEVFRAAGVDDFIHIRLNCLQFLAQLQKQLGLAH